MTSVGLGSSGYHKIAGSPELMGMLADEMLNRQTLLPEGKDRLWKMKHMGREGVREIVDTFERRHPGAVSITDEDIADFVKEGSKKVGREWAPAHLISAKDLLAIQRDKEMRKQL